MVRSLSVAAWAALSALASAAPTSSCTTVQHNFPSNFQGHPDRAEAVKAEYRYVWNQYKQQAFPKDELLPITHNGTNDLFGWGASVIDGIDTAMIMGLTDIVNEQLTHIANFKFDHSVGPVNEFDATIRYIGGLLSAYDVVNSPVVPKGTYDKKKTDALLSQAAVIADHISIGFNTPSGLPMRYYNFSSNQSSNCADFASDCTTTSVNTAQVGSMVLEWYRLSDLTGNPKYRNLVARAEKTLISPNQNLKYPNLVGSTLNDQTGKYITMDIGWEAGIDSFYEYLIKTWVYNPKGLNTVDYKNYWVGTVDSTEKYLVQHPYQRPGLTFISQADTNGNLEYSMDDYACFAGGNLLLGGQYLKRNDILNLGYAVTDSCHALFNTSKAGLNPSQWSWFNSKNQTYNPSDAQNPSNVAYAKRTGYFVDDPSWGAYPEPLESIYYAYRISGDERWADYSWEAFQNILKDTNRQKGVTFAQLTNVTQPLGGDLVNIVQAFYFAEVLKYLYLTFSKPSLISLDEWVFNTEAHPFHIQGGTCATNH